jgi:tRNA-modifying protein YgfZ
MAGDDNSRMNQNLDGVARLSDWGLISATGVDARNFLHNQLTQDVLHLEPTQARLAGFCSPKGRLMASFVVWSPTADEVLLACSADVLPAVLKRLSMFVLRAKCKLSDVSAQWQLWGLAGRAVARPDASPWQRDVDAAASVIRLPDAAVDAARLPLALWCAPTDVPPPGGTALALSSWQWLEVHSGTARIVAATVEQFVPQMVNLELVGGVNFQKGCYPGQEIVARSQYRGTIKRRAAVVHSDAALVPGQEVFAEDEPDQPVGMVVLAGSHGAQHAALVELKIAAMQSRLRAGAVDGPRLTLGALPYAIPVDAE